MRPHTITPDQVDPLTLNYLELVAQKRGQEAIDAWMMWTGWREVSNYKRRTKTETIENKSAPVTKKSIEIGSSGQVVRKQKSQEWRLYRARYLALTMQIALEKATRTPPVKTEPKTKPKATAKRKPKKWQIREDLP
jgi:hypothetical protein